MKRHIAGLLSYSLALGAAAGTQAQAPARPGSSQAAVSPHPDTPRPIDALCPSGKAA